MLNTYQNVVVKPVVNQLNLVRGLISRNSTAYVSISKIIVSKGLNADVPSFVLTLYIAPFSLSLASSFLLSSNKYCL